MQRSAFLSTLPLVKQLKCMRSKKEPIGGAAFDLLQLVLYLLLTLF